MKRPIKAQITKIGLPFKIKDGKVIINNNGWEFNCKNGAVGYSFGESWPYGVGIAGYTIDELNVIAESNPYA